MNDNLLDLFDNDSVPTESEGSLPAAAEDPFDLGGDAPEELQNAMQMFEAKNTPTEPLTAIPATESTQIKETAAQESDAGLFSEDNPFEQAIAQMEEQTVAGAAQMLQDQPPSFCYSGVTEPIEDRGMTFEQLRQQKQEDFPELEDRRRVSWSLEYGGLTQKITAPDKEEIWKAKQEMEQSKEFLAKLKRARAKKPMCVVKPTITMKSKGAAAYRGAYLTEEEAQASGKLICLVPARDGKVYEIRYTEMGRFAVPTAEAAGLSEISAGFVPALPPVPYPLFAQVIAFFRSFLQQGRDCEAFVQIYWDKQERQYILHVPPQSVGPAFVHARLDAREFSLERYIAYMEIHSHHTMQAFFSAEDDRDERAARIYVVAGRLDRFYPQVKARICCGGVFQPIDPALVIEPPSQPCFPAEWPAAVTKETAGKGIPHEI